MKQLLLLLVSSMTFITVQAQHESQRNRFAFVFTPFKAGDDMYQIRIDSGQAPIERKASIMKDSTGKSLQFVSPAAALNYMESIGWKLQKVLNEAGNSFLFKKDY